MRILSYNIYNCLEHSQAFETLAAAIDSLHADTLMLNEYRTNGHGERVRAALEGVGYGWHEIGRAGENCSAIFSRQPFKVLANRDHLRMVAAWQNGVVLCAWHASPCGVAEVLRELGEVTAILDGHDDVLLAGDLNSLAAADREVLGYPADSDHLSRYRHRSGLSYEAMNRLLAAGLRDLNRDAKRYTVPTAVGRKAEAGWRLRLDHALGKGAPARRFACETLRGRPWDTLSDHYPLLIRPSA